MFQQWRVNGWGVVVHCSFPDRSGGSGLGVGEVEVSVVGTLVSEPLGGRLIAFWSMSNFRGVRGVGCR